jgi:hypothetical protein
VKHTEFAFCWRRVLSSFILFYFILLFPLFHPSSLSRALRAGRLTSSDTSCTQTSETLVLTSC